ncbi:hypothetical protein EU537_00730 [Candidatus Thorarchaeota archaeon]|nr:MAG: hypothetical protein EU537_00730 [Candidatus Thorarchaeota archaeon]
MPMVELVAKKVLQRNPDIGLTLVDLIVLLWLYTNPYDSNRRQLSSMKNVLKMSQVMQTPVGRLEVTDDELTQIVLGSLRKLKSKGLIYISSAGVHYVRGTLTEAGLELVENSVSTPLLRRVTTEFGDSP